MAPAQGGIRSNRSPLVHDLGNSGHWNPQIERQAVHADPKRFHELGAENLTGMDRRKPFLRFSHRFLQ
jgi:hypothetical protein